MSETASPPPRPAAAGRIIDAVTGAIAATTGPALVGLYLCGSLATGDFDERMSDIDLLAVLSTEVSPDLAAQLERTPSASGLYGPSEPNASTTSS